VTILVIRDLPAGFGDAYKEIGNDIVGFRKVFINENVDGLKLNN
jgi:hypothetical protein